MATFTATLSELMEMRDVDTVEECVRNHVAVFGLNTYPIFDENYRDILNEKIIRRYWNREIGHETSEMFRFRMQTRMAELMPYYNELYLSTRLDFDPLSTMDIRTVADNSTTHSENGSTLSSNITESGSRTVNSITPQAQLSDNGEYADSMADANSKGQASTTGSQTGEGEQRAKVNSHTTGYQAVPADLIRKYRDTLINVDLMVLGHLSTLFMSVFQTSDSNFTQNGSFYGSDFAQ